jgi:hypothetical protein
MQKFSDKILLVQHHSLYDPETGGDYVIKRVKQVWADDGSVAGVQLISANQKYPVKEITGEDAAGLSIKAELVEVLGNLSQGRGL